MRNDMKKIVTIPDYERMMSRKYYALLKAKMPEIVEYFFLELNDAQLLDQTEISKDVVTMNSKVLLKELKRRRKLEVMITYPEEANDQERKVSVFSPIGTALLGRTVGDHVSWKIQGGQAEFEILDITYQPEAVGDFDL